MKNKNGFTLIEIIVCIILLTSIAVISFIIIKNPKEKDERIDFLYSSANILLETNNEYKNAYLEDKIVYIKINDLITQGLIDEKKYSDYSGKCIKITENSNEVTQCITLAKLNVENFINNVCYLNASELPTIKFSIDLVDNENNEFVSVVISSNGVIKKEITELKSEYSYKVEDNDKNLEIVFNYKDVTNQNKRVVWKDDSEYILTKIPTLTYTNNKLSILDNNNVNLSYSLDNSNYVETNLEEINNKVNTYNQDLYLKVNGNCIEEKTYQLKYGYTLNKSGISKSNIMFGIGDNPGGKCASGNFIQRPLYYFKDGSFLYEYSYYYKNSNCGIARGTWIYFVDPSNNIKKQILYLPGQSSSGWSFDVKIVKSTENIFNLYTIQNSGMGASYGSYSAAYYPIYTYRNYEYNHSNNSITLTKELTPYNDFYSSCRTQISSLMGSRWNKKCSNNLTYQKNHDLYLSGYFVDVNNTYATVNASSTIDEYDDSKNASVKNLICNYQVASYMETNDIIWTYNMDSHSCKKIWEDSINYYVMYYFNTIMSNGFQEWHNIVKFPKVLVNKFAISNL